MKDWLKALDRILRGEMTQIGNLREKWRKVYMWQINYMPKIPLRRRASNLWTGS